MPTFIQKLASLLKKPDCGRQFIEIEFEGNVRNKIDKIKEKVRHAFDCFAQRYCQCNVDKGETVLDGGI